MSSLSGLDSDAWSVNQGSSIHMQYRSPQMMQQFWSELAHRSPYLACSVSFEDRKAIVLACLKTVAEAFCDTNTEPLVTLGVTPDDVKALIAFIGAQSDGEAAVTASAASKNVESSASSNDTNNNANTPATLDVVDNELEDSVMGSASNY